VLDDDCGRPSVFALQLIQLNTFGIADIQETIVKNLPLTGCVVTLLLTSSVVAGQAPADEHAGHHPPGATSPEVPPGAKLPTQATSPTPVPRMQDNMKKMQDLMTKIHASKDPAERRQLLQQHGKAMQEQMGMMRGMAGGQGEMQSGGMMMMGGAHAPGTTQGDTPKGEAMPHMMMDHQAMRARMDMMQMMMDQMLQHQDTRQESAATKQD
jgi:hypothetical protein